MENIYNNQVEQWPEFESDPLPADIASLPTMVAEPWVCVGPGDARGLLEGPIFDAEGNFYVGYTTRPVASIVKITQDKTISTLRVNPEGEMSVGLAVHQDGRIFAATLCEKYGKILVLNKDGSLEREIVPEYDGEILKPDDLVFDMDGNLFFTDFRGSLRNPIGGVYRLDAQSDYTRVTKLLGDIASGNGISFSPEYDVLWVAETTRNEVLRINMENGFVRPSYMAVQSVFKGTGHPVVDSNKVDSEGNLYQAMMWGGRILVLNKWGTPVANIVAPGREKGEHLNSPNLVLKPGTDEGYMLATGIDGAWIFKFKALAKAQELFSHKK